MYTRKEHMAGACGHNEYYQQFVDVNVKHLVAEMIGIERIKNSKDPHFNDIPLKEWDRLMVPIRRFVGKLLAEANGSGGISLSDCVCTAKAAARMIKGDYERL